MKPTRNIEQQNESPENDETSETAQWIADTVDTDRLNEFIHHGASKEQALLAVLTERLHDETLSDEENRRVFDLRNSLLMVTFPNLPQESRVFYQEVTASIPGMTDIEVTPQLREDLATLLAQQEIELPQDDSADSPSRRNMLLPPEES